MLKASFRANPVAPPAAPSVKPSLSSLVSAVKNPRLAKPRATEEENPRSSFRLGGLSASVGSQASSRSVTKQRSGKTSEMCGTRGACRAPSSAATPYETASETDKKEGRVEGNGQEEEIGEWAMQRAHLV